MRIPVVQDLIQQMRRGEKSALARLLTRVERGGDQAAEVLELAHPYTGNAYVVGITGPPGAGKSTLASQLTTLLRSHGEKVGILAMDPTSPFTGGAFLGDRIRMQAHYLDTGVFIRSMATRGSSGGLPRKTRCAIRLLDAWGAGIVLVETVGVGQTELEVMGAADTVVVVLVPEAGDAIQTLKAGLLEIADIFVVNKADRDGASQMVAHLEATLGLAPTYSEWKPPVLQTQADEKKGIEALLSNIQEHRDLLLSSSRLQEMRRYRQRREFLLAIQEGMADILRGVEERGGENANLLAAVEAGEEDPFVAAWRLLRSDVLLEEWFNHLKGGR